MPRIFVRFEWDVSIQTESDNRDLEPSDGRDWMEYVCAEGEDPHDLDLHRRLCGKPRSTPGFRPVVRKPRFIVTARNNAGEEVEALRVAMEPGQEPAGMGPRFAAYRVLDGVDPMKADFRNPAHAAPVGAAPGKEGRTHGGK